MSRFSNTILAFFVVVLTGVGAVVLGADLRGDGALHFLNAAVGAGALVVAVALALPVQLKAVVGELLPVAIALRKGAA